MREPDIKTSFGKAWTLRVVKLKTAAASACLGHWLLNVPGAHPFWENWHVMVISLADIPGVPPAHKKYPTAEYEFLIASINPEDCPSPSPDETSYPLLSPVDVAEQFDGVSEHDAVRVGFGAVRTILNGHMSPDSDFRRLWHQLIQNTVAHFKAGQHPEN
jgi:hypothetical protein